ncbi:hypothetical protein [Armatimonas sp.]|uniref:hypothetical protein n=1 Tax=Armatimonas sp. TaxID=1872638 RepID=UPI00286B6CD3|nr:hypothetical protein [Armatimonas sp.]
MMINTLPLYVASEGTYADWLTKTAPMLDALATQPKVRTLGEQKQCPDCEEWFPLSEFEHPFYCHQSEGMESETTELCRECLREENDRLQDEASELRQDERDAEDGFSQRAYEDHLADMADTAAEFDDY